MQQKRGAVDGHAVAYPRFYSPTRLLRRNWQRVPESKMFTPVRSIFRRRADLPNALPTSAISAAMAEDAASDETSGLEYPLE